MGKEGEHCTSSGPCAAVFLTVCCFVVIYLQELMRFALRKGRERLYAQQSPVLGCVQRLAQSLPALCMLWMLQAYSSA